MKPMREEKQLQAILIACRTSGIMLSDFLSSKIKLEGYDQAPKFRGDLTKINDSVKHTFSIGQHTLILVKFRSLLGEADYTKLIHGQLSLRRQASVPATMSQVPVLSLA